MFFPIRVRMEEGAQNQKILSPAAVRCPSGIFRILMPGAMWVSLYNEKTMTRHYEKQANKMKKGRQF